MAQVPPLVPLLIVLMFVQSQNVGRELVLVLLVFALGPCKDTCEMSEK